MSGKRHIFCPDGATRPRRFKSSARLAWYSRKRNCRFCGHMHAGSCHDHGCGSVYPWYVILPHRK